MLSVSVLLVQNQELFTSNNVSRVIEQFNDFTCAQRITDALIDVVHVANEFVRANESRYAHLVNFSFACIYMHCTVYICVLLYCSD